MHNAFNAQCSQYIMYSYSYPTVTLMCCARRPCSSWSLASCTYGDAEYSGGSVVVVVVWWCRRMLGISVKPTWANSAVKCSLNGPDDDRMAKSHVSHQCQVSKNESKFLTLTNRSLSCCSCSTRASSSDTSAVVGVSTSLTWCVCVCVCVCVV